MTNYSASQDVTITISGEGFDLETVLGVDIKFRVHAGRAATLEEPAESPHAEITSYTASLKSDQGGIANGTYQTVLSQHVAGGIELEQDWLLAQAAEADAAAEDDRADALREERLLEARG